MPVVDVNGARLWYDEAGRGEVVLLLHGGLGDSGLWEPVVPFLAERFRVVRTDFRFFGRSAGPFAPFSFRDDTVGVLDELGIERAALVGLSLGAAVAFDVALDRPERVRAVAGVAPALSGLDVSVDDEAWAAAYEEAAVSGDAEALMAMDFELWAPLGVEQRFVRLWRETPDADPLPPGVEALRPAVPATERIDDLRVPALLVTVTHDPPALRSVASLVPGARHVELDSDHYVTLREPEALSRVLLDFLAST